MLPRNINRKASKNTGNQEENYKEFRENINSNVGPNFNKKGHGEHHQVPMKKLSVNNMVNHNNGQRHMSQMEQRRHSPIPQNGGNFMGNFSNNNHNNNGNGKFQNNNSHHYNSNPIKPNQQGSPNRYISQQNNPFLVQQNEPISKVMR